VIQVRRPWAPVSAGSGYSHGRCEPGSDASARDARRHSDLAGASHVEWVVAAEREHVRSTLSVTTLDAAFAPLRHRPDPRAIGCGVRHESGRDRATGFEPSEGDAGDHLSPSARGSGSEHQPGTYS
jgi:hypothetical protein